MATRISAFSINTPASAGNNIRMYLLPCLAWLMILAFLFLAAGCDISTEPESSAPAKKPPRQEYDYQLSPEAMLEYKYLVLNEAVSKGDMETALEMVNDLLEIAPSPDIYIQAISLLDQNNRPDEALQVARNGAVRYADDYTLHIMWAELLERQNRVDTALLVLKNFAARYKQTPLGDRHSEFDELTSVRQYIVYLLLDNNRTEEASNYIAGIPVSERSPTLLFYEILILRHDNRSREATVKLYELVKNYPDFTDGWITLARDMEKSGNYQSAVRFYQKALETAPLADIYLYMVRAMIKAGSVPDATRQLVSSPFAPEVKVRAALIFMDEKLFKEARQILLSVQNEPSVVEDVNLYLGMIAYDSGENLDEAMERLQDISSDAPNRARMLYLKALLHIKMNDYAGASNTAQTLRDDYPDNKENWAFLAEMANAVKDYKLSESVSREALELWPEDVNLLYSLAMSLSFQKKNNEAIPILEEILMLDDDNVIALNALGYTLAEENRELDRALDLVQKALEQQPDNVGIMDSLAWVHYKKGNYAEAWRIIRQCAGKGVEDAIIWDHYGDIAQAMGNTKAAKMGYSRALELDADDSKEIRNKLKRLK